MLTPERHRYILHILKKNGAVSVRELAEGTASSESTIRRDLIQLEEEGKLIRFHGGAQSLGTRAEEKTVEVRKSQHQEEKKAIGKKAAEFVEAGDCIFLDAGTTTSHMINHLPKDIIVVTNGITHVEPCIVRGITVYLLGGQIKATTRAIVGKGAFDSLRTYRFDKCFMGMNGIDLANGLTTPDPEEAHIKRIAMELSKEIFVLADASKLGTVSFSFVYPLDGLTIITSNKADLNRLKDDQNQTNIKVVTA